MFDGIKRRLVSLAVTAACAMLLLWVGLSYESRLNAAHRLSQRKEAEARARRRR